MNDDWYKDKRLLKAAHEEYGSLSRAARAVGGVNRSTLALWWKKLGLEDLPPGPMARKATNEEALQAIYKRVYGGE